MTRPKHILIAGCGYLGEKIGQLCLDSGQEVTAVRRSDTLLPNIFHHRMAIDLSRPFVLNQAYDVVFFCPAPSKGDAANYEETYLNGIRNLTQALRKHNEHAHLIFISSTSVYGQCDGEDVSEDSPTEPLNQNGEIMLAAEQEALRFNEKTTILRLGGIYGPGRTAFLTRLHKEPALETQNVFSNRIHVVDAARSALFVADKSVTGIFNVVDSHPTPINDIIRWICEKWRIPLVKTHLSSVSGMRGNKRVLNIKLVRQGFQFQYPSYKEGFSELLAETKL